MTPEIYTKIEVYLDGTLPDPDRRVFEAAMQNDPALAQAVAVLREARERLTRQWAAAPADAALQATLQELGRTHFPQNAAPDNTRSLGGGTFRVSRTWWAAAAALAVLFVAWLFLRPPQHERLYAEHRDFPEAAFALRGNNDALVQAAETAFNSGDYQTALSNLGDHLAGTPSDTEKLFFAGLCYLELNRHEEARAAFQQAATAPAWADEAHWFLALGYLRENKRNECLAALEKIDSTNSRYASATILRRQLGQ